MSEEELKIRIEQQRYFGKRAVDDMLYRLRKRLWPNVHEYDPIELEDHKRALEHEFQMSLEHMIRIGILTPAVRVPDAYSWTRNPA